jgi:hypothetical protein
MPQGDCQYIFLHGCLAWLKDAYPAIVVETYRMPSISNGRIIFSFEKILLGEESRHI